MKRERERERERKRVSERVDELSARRVALQPIGVLSQDRCKDSDSKRRERERERDWNMNDVSERVCGKVVEGKKRKSGKLKNHSPSETRRLHPTSTPVGPCLKPVTHSPLCSLPLCHCSSTSSRHQLVDFVAISCHQGSHLKFPGSSCRFPPDLRVPQLLFQMTKFLSSCASLCHA